MKFEVRASVEMTVDFEIEADSESEAKQKAKDYLPYIDCGRLEDQPVTVKTNAGDDLTNLFIMGVEIEDCNEAD